MSTNNIILTIVEPDTHPHEVVDRAIWLAGVTGCSLELLLCDPEIGPLQDRWYVSAEAKEIGRRIAAAQSEMIEELADNARDMGVTVTTGVLEDRPIAEAIIARILDATPRYVVKGTEYHSAAERAIFVDTDWQLIRSCPCPLYLVKPLELRENPVIIAAVDPTHGHDKPAALDQIIIDNARYIADRCGGEVHLLHTYQRLAGIGHEATRTFKPIEIPVDELDQKIRAEHRARLDELAAKNDFKKEYVHQLPGRTRELLPTFARSRKADIVVMGALARWGWRRAILGSTAERVLDHLPCDVLIVRPSADQPD